VVLDGKHSVSVESLTFHGMKEDNVILLTKNGTEYYYPLGIMREIYGRGDDLIYDSILVHENSVSVGDVVISKVLFAGMVVEKIAKATELDTEVKAFLQTLSRKLRMNE
jgi:hypothetical protein